MLEGLPAYPEALFTGVLRRIRADGRMSRRRAAILKAFLKREGRYDVDVYLNKEHPDKAYQLRAALRGSGLRPGRRRWARSTRASFAATWEA